MITSQNMHKNSWTMQVRPFVGEPPFCGGCNEWTIPFTWKIFKIFPTELSVSSEGPKGHFGIKFTTLNSISIAVGVVPYDRPNPDPLGGGLHVTNLLFFNEIETFEIGIDVTFLSDVNL